MPISKNNVIQPIKISFNEKFIESTVLKTDPPNRDISLSNLNENHSVECKFDLLNSHDYFTLQFVRLNKLTKPTILQELKVYQG